MCMQPWECLWVSKRMLKAYAARLYPRSFSSLEYVYANLGMFVGEQMNTSSICCISILCSADDACVIILLAAKYVVQQSTCLSLVIGAPARVLILVGEEGEASAHTQACVGNMPSITSPRPWYECNCVVLGSRCRAYQSPQTILCHFSFLYVATMPTTPLRRSTRLHAQIVNQTQGDLPDEYSYCGMLPSFHPNRSCLTLLIICTYCRNVFD